jgi:hypothetical protein
MGHNLGDALGLGELLRELHHQPRDGDAAGRPQKLGLVRVLHAHRGRLAHDVLGVRLHVVPLELSQLPLEVAHLELQVHDVVAGDLAALGGVVVLAVRVGALAGPAARQSGVASRLALDAVSGGEGRCREGARLPCGSGSRLSGCVRCGSGHSCLPQSAARLPS